jgi:enoyl-[acyl-carrier protein] reductase II
MYDKHQTHFACQYPVICAGMNAVSDVNLALAIKKSGCYPSFVAYNHTIMVNDNPLYSPKVLYQDLKEYIDKGGDSNFILGLAPQMITRNPHTMRILDSIKPAYIELLDYSYIADAHFTEYVKQIKSNGTKILVKMLSYDTVASQLSNGHFNWIDGIVLKGNKAAGRVIEHSENLLEIVKKTRNLLPEPYIIIAQGGIYDAAGIQEYLTAGANAVSLGTMFALSKESPISIDAKHKLLSASYADAVTIGKVKQRGIVFSKIEDNDNNTPGLRKGIESGQEGHIFVGAALDHISQIMPISEIVQELVTGL